MREVIHVKAVKSKEWAVSKLPQITRKTILTYLTGLPGTAWGNKLGHLPDKGNQEQMSYVKIVPGMPRDNFDIYNFDMSEGCT